MLFNSPEFIYVFLPVILMGFFLLARFGQRLAAIWLAAGSLFFYGWWNPAYVGLLVGSVLFNYAMGLILAREASRPQHERRVWLLALGVGIDLVVLGYYKYTNFFLNSANVALNTTWNVEEIILPLGISFFTFTQIAFLVDAWRGIAREFNFIHYILFVTFFPHLIAGPILHHKEMMPQFGQAKTYRMNWENLAVGLTIFAIGLFKKVMLADGMAPYVKPVFDAAQRGADLTFWDAWAGVLAYALQLYFDFSGYSDMAIGLARMFGVRFPLNFNSPYQALSIIDFWRRWHITLSRFLRDYVYISLGGNRKGSGRRYANLLATMLLGGLWHGAGWTFVIWGGLHGLYLVVNHAWIQVRRRLKLPEGRWWTRALAWSLTFLSILVGWVFFRAADFKSASNLLVAMFGGHGWFIPTAWTDIYWRIGAVAQKFGLPLRHAGDHAPSVWGWLSILGLLIAATRLPNTQSILADFQPALNFVADTKGQWRFRLNATWVVLTILLLAAALTRGEAISEFLYFQF